ncbi:hypothetical protein [Pseudactinotalea terrae]|uniref:hypothetical protein n=1 Tax=Pseudactinotalea terrae TaxID=1743262 RepID=UPI0012E2BF12|nr:hypothetical protein [Pseudactinotalea terrae]
MSDPEADRVGSWLVEWLRYAEQDWHTRQDDAALEQGWYGSGYTGWGAQTTLQYLAAAGAVAVHAATPDTRRWARRRALAALRYSIATHVTGFADAEDGRRWGRTWISVLGLERAGWVIDELGPELEPRYRAGLDQLLVDEADWQAEHHERAGEGGIRGSRWSHEGLNRPESNLWCGAHLWRTAERYPDHPRAQRWRDVAVPFLLNAVSVPSDATSDEVRDGVRVADVHGGPNFFESYALDHHDYLNVGYMVICTSNAAFAHLDLLSQGRAVPESLSWHQGDLWQRIRALVAPDGRLVRVGGDTRVRYAYCQEYLLPALQYAEHELGDTGASELASAYLRLVERERAETSDGSLYGRRLDPLGIAQPYYRARLETDRACVLGRWLHHAARRVAGRPADPEPTTSAWSDDEHGFAMTRGENRIASASWRAASGTQVLAFPTARPDMAEWALNLCPVLRFEGDGAPASPTESPKAQRRLAGYQLETFDGGFLTAARVEEGCALRIAEGWHGAEPVADSWIVVAALPDDATVVGLHLARARGLRPPLLSALGLNLLIPNDVHTTSEHSIVGVDDEALCVDGQLDVVSDQPLSVSSHPVSSTSGLRSIGVERIAAGARHGRYWVPAGGSIVEAAWVVRVRRPEDARPRLVHEVDDAGTHRVDVTVPGGTWRLEFDPHAQDQPTWGERVGALSLAPLGAGAPQHT